MLLTLSGCATVNDAWDYFDMARFDNNEYMLANKVRTFRELFAGSWNSPMHSNHSDASCLVHEGSAAFLVGLSLTGQGPLYM